MDVTNRYVLDFAKRFVAARPGARILDYGCGAGAVVSAARQAGLDASGVDVYYGGSETRTEAERSGLLGSVIHEMDGGRTPFADSSFHLIVNNQVLEHVEDLDAVLAELDRVLTPDGLVLSLFPSRDVFREGHIGIPFSHWFAKGSKLRFYYTWTLRSLGLGIWKEQAPTCRQWAVDKLEWLDRYTHYRTRREIDTTFAQYFHSRPAEATYIRFRLLDRPGRQPIARLLDVPGGPAIASAIFRKLAFLVLVSGKKKP